MKEDNKDKVKGLVPGSIAGCHDGGLTWWKGNLDFNYELYDNIVSAKGGEAKIKLENNKKKTRELPKILYFIYSPYISIELNN